MERLRFCQEKKGLVLYAWVIMSNHVHLIAAAREGHDLPDIMRDSKKVTALRVLKEISENNQESRKDWMMPIFARAGTANPNNRHFQIWRQDNRPVQLVTAEVFNPKLQYLHDILVVEGYVAFAEEYVYSSAPALAGKPGLLQLEPSGVRGKI